MHLLLYIQFDTDDCLLSSYILYTGSPLHDDCAMPLAEVLQGSVKLSRRPSLQDTGQNIYSL
jgi:hypothetical protein